MKNFVVAVLLALLITFCLGSWLQSWGGFHLHLGDQLISPLVSVGSVVLVGFILVLIGFVIAVSLFGVIAFVASLVIGGLFLVGFSAFWPAILVLAVIIWLAKTNTLARE